MTKRTQMEKKLYYTAGRNNLAIMEISMKPPQIKSGISIHPAIPLWMYTPKTQSKATIGMPKHHWLL